MESDTDTIAAISTPLGEGGIGIVRISGEDSFGIGKKIFSPRRKNISGYPRSHCLYYGHILSRGGEVSDEVLVTFMKAPHTYTREDTVEINCHSGILMLRAILKRTLESGARIAGPGEFTKRAFLNGRIDLSQAESVMRIIRARSDEAVKAALSTLHGDISKEISKIREQILGVLARIEAHIDFPEDLGDDRVMEEENMAELPEIMERLNKMARGSERGRALQDGLTTAIVGKPNVGKSALLNALLGVKRAIVHDIPGTTRDLLEGFLTAGGYPLRLLDTAGIHSSADPVEREGITRAKGAVDEARLLIVVLDGSTPWNENDEAVASLIGPEHIAVIVINKMDLERQLSSREVSEKLKGYPIVHTAAIFKRGIDELERTIVELLDRRLGGAASESPLIVSLRHAEIIDEVYDLIDQAMQNLGGGSPELASIDLREAWHKAGAITGEEVTTELLDCIFGEFCIGK